MPTGVSSFLQNNISLLSAICDPLTERKIVRQILKSCNKQMILAIQELLLNITNKKLAKIVQKIRHKSHNIKKKRQIIVKHWKQIRVVILPLIRQLLNNGDGETQADA